jgi:hypothetical protein
LSQAARVVRLLPALVCASSLALPASAQPAEEAVRFQYTAPAECPDAASFTARVRQRTARGRLANEGELARTFTLNVSADATGFLGGIEFLDDGGTQVSRRVRGEQCEAVVDSLALITALSLDATLREEETAPAVQPEKSLPTPPAPALFTPSAHASAPVPAPRVVRRRALASARVGVVGGYDTASHALPLGLLGQLDWRSGVALRFVAHYVSDDGFTVDEQRRARLRLLGLESSVCPWRLHAGDFGLAPCVDFDLGSLRVEGLKEGKLTSASGETNFWAAAGPELRLAWEPDVPFWVELRGALAFPLVRHRWEFERPQKTVYEVPWSTTAAGVATGVRFW